MTPMTRMQIPSSSTLAVELPGDGPNIAAKGDSPRMRLFDFIERLITWEATTDETIMGQARELIRIATGGNPPPLLDPFAGGGSIPLAQQLLLAYISQSPSPRAANFRSHPPKYPHPPANTGTRTPPHELSRSLAKTRVWPPFSK